MELVLLLLVVGLTLAGKSAIEHVAEDFRTSTASAMKAAEKKAAPGKLSKSRRAATQARHARGWGLSELLHGFPVARTGWHTGWLANKAAADHMRALREEARTSQMETRASVLSGIPEHRRRQAEARQQIEQSLAKDPQATGKKAVEKAASNVVLFPTRRVSGDAPLPSETVDRPEPGPYAKPADDPPWLQEVGERYQVSGEIPNGWTPEGEPTYPADDLAGHLKAPMPDPRLNDRQRERDAAGKGNKCASCGHDGWAEDPLAVTSDGYRNHESHTTDPESGYFGQVADPLPETTPQATPSASNGNGVQPMPATDTTYNEVLNAARAAVAQSDQDSASIAERKKAAYDLADQMAAAHVDPAVINAQMEHADNLARAEEALATAGESAQSTAQTLERYHGGVQEAVDDSPGLVANREFHEGA